MIHDISTIYPNIFLLGLKEEYGNRLEDNAGNRLEENAAVKKLNW